MGHGDMLKAYLPEFNMAMTPEGKPITGDAIGIPNTILARFYEEVIDKSTGEQARADYISTGKGTGTGIMKLKNEFSSQEFIEAKSLFEAGKMNLKDYERIKTKHDISTQEFIDALILTRNNKTAWKAFKTLVTSQLASQSMTDMMSDKRVVKAIEENNPLEAKNMTLESYVANLKFQAGAGKAMGLLSAETMDNISQELILLDKKYKNPLAKIELINGYLAASKEGEVARLQWENDNIDAFNAMEIGLMSREVELAETKEVLDNTKQYKKGLLAKFEGEGEITLNDGEVVTNKEIREVINSVKSSTIGTKTINGVKYKKVYKKDIQENLKNIESLRGFFPKYLSEKQKVVMDALLGEGWSQGHGQHENLIDAETGEVIGEDLLIDGKIPYSRNTKAGDSRQGEKTEFVEENWGDIESLFNDLTSLGKKKGYLKLQEKLFAEGKSLKEVKEEMKKIFNKKDNEAREKIYLATAKARKAWLDSSTNKEQYLSRLKTLMQISAANTSIELGDRQFMAIEAIEIDANMDLSQRSKLEHGVAQVVAGVRNTELMLSGDFDLGMRDLQDIYQGLYGREPGFDIVDKAGGKTNMSGAYTRIMAYHESQGKTFYTVKSGFEKDLSTKAMEEAIAETVSKTTGKEVTSEELFKNKITQDLFVDAMSAENPLQKKVALFRLENARRNQEVNEQMRKVGIKEVNLMVNETFASKGINDFSTDLKNEVKGLTPRGVKKLSFDLTKIEQASSNIVNAIENKKASVFDGDEVLWIHDVKIGYELPNGKKGELTNTQFNKRQKGLEKRGAIFNYDAFNTLEGAQPGPLMNEFVKRVQEGNSTVFISTARANNPQIRTEIVDYVNARGVEKYGADWKGFNESHLDTVEGSMDTRGESLKVTNTLVNFKTGDNAAGVIFNEVDFFDDHKPTTKHWAHAQRELNLSGSVYTVVHKSGKGEQLSAEIAKEKGILFDMGPDKALNLMIQDQAGIDANKVFSKVKAQLRGKNKRRFKILPDNAQDFIGLCYAFVGKGKKGDAQIEFINEAITKGITLGEGVIEKESLRIGKDYKSLLKTYPGIKKNLNQKLEGDLKDFTVEDAIRIYTWSTQGKDIEGISKTDLKNIKDFMEQNPEGLAFSQELLELSNVGAYEGGSYQDLLTGNIWSDLAQTVDTQVRDFYMQGVKNNLDLMFTEDNLNKLEAAYGPKYRAAMEDHIEAIKTGKNRAYTLGPTDTKAYNFLNNANGALMTLNFRSATLQLTSTFNYINWGDNNIAKAGLAFANQPQFWSDYSKLWNQLEGRRSGNKLNIAESEIADALRTGKQNKGQAIISYLISKGYAPTKIADSFAIAFGGASFYRNRINSLVKKGMSKEMAEEQALIDWRDATESHQQSRRTDKLSPIQRTLKGRFMLGFHTTPMQYTRLIDKSVKDLRNNRGSTIMNISRIINYGAIQPAVFHGLQAGAFMMLFQEDTEEHREKKMTEILKGGAGSLIEGTGTWGVVTNTLYKAVDKYYKEKEKEGTYPGPKYWKAGLEVLNLSPSIGGKVKMGLSAMYDQMYKDPYKTWKIYDPENPNAKSTLKIIQTVTNLPAKELHEFYGAMYKAGVQFIGAGATQMDAIKIAAILLGWPEWQLESEYQTYDKRADEKAEKKINKKINDGTLIKDDGLKFGDGDLDFGDGDLDLGDEDMKF